MNTRYIPSWEELKQAKKVHRLNKFTGGEAERVSTSLVAKCVFLAIRGGERVYFPIEWKKIKYVSKAQYEKWYNEYQRHRMLHDTELITEVRYFSTHSNLSRDTWNILQGEEDDD